MNPHPDNPIMAAMWAGFVQWAFTEPGIVAAFESATGMKRPPAPKNGLEALIDQATGINEQYVEAFAEWVTREMWGVEDAPKNETR